jgi:hypothetical protein
MPSRAEYVASTRDRRRRQFSVSGQPSIEQAYRTHAVSPKLSEAKRRRESETSFRAPELVAINGTQDSCTKCFGPVCHGGRRNPGWGSKHRQMPWDRRLGGLRDHDFDRRRRRCALVNVEN